MEAQGPTRRQGEHFRTIESRESGLRRNLGGTRSFVSPIPRAEVARSVGARGHRAGLRPQKFGTRRSAANLCRSVAIVTSSMASQSSWTQNGFATKWRTPRSASREKYGLSIPPLAAMTLGRGLFSCSKNRVSDTRARAAGSYPPQPDSSDASATAVISSVARSLISLTDRSPNRIDSSTPLVCDRPDSIGSGFRDCRRRAVLL